MPDSKSDSGSDSEGEDTLPRTKEIRSGWGTSPTEVGSKISGSKSDEESDDDDDSKRAEKKKPRKRKSRFRKPSKRHGGGGDSSEEEPIMLIPTLEEEGDEEVYQMPIVAPAPKVLTLNIRSIEELNRDIKFSLPTASEGGIDLSALTRSLVPQSSLQESDKEWKFESLLQEVAQDINKELEAIRIASQAVEANEESLG